MKSRKWRWLVPLLLALFCPPMAAKPRASAQQMAQLKENAFGAIWIDSDLEPADIEAEVRAALDAGVSPNARGDGGETLLLQAIENQQLSTILLLLRRGANPNLAVIAPKSARPLGETPLMRAVSMHDSLFNQKADRLQIMRWLLARGANRDLRDKAGNSALLLATAEGRSDAAALLLKYRANFRLRDAKGQTALQIALIPIPRGSIGITGGAFWTLPASGNAAAMERAWEEGQKQEQLEARRMEKRISQGRAAIIRLLRAAGAKA